MKAQHFVIGAVALGAVLIMTREFGVSQYSSPGAPVVPTSVPSGNKQGNGSLFQLSSGAFTPGDCLKYDANGNAVDFGGTCQPNGSTLFSSTADAGPSNTASETSLIASPTGSTTIAANTFTNGSALEVEAQGYLTMNGTDTLTVNVKCGSTVIGTTSSAISSALSNASFRLWLLITARGTGASGSLTTNGIFEAIQSTSATAQRFQKILNTSPVSYDFTTACAMDVTAQFSGTGGGSENVTGTSVIAYFPGGQKGSAGPTGVTGPTGSAGGTALPPYVQIGASYYGPIYALTPPPASGWSWINQGGSTVSNVNGSLQFAFDQTATGVFVYGRALPASSGYTITACFNSMAYNGSGLYDSVSGKLVFAYWDEGPVFGFSYPSFNYQKLTNFTTASSNYINGGNIIQQPSPMLCEKWVDDGTNRTLQIGYDGTNFGTVISTASRTDFLTPDTFIVGSYSIAASLQTKAPFTLLQYTGTTP